MNECWADTNDENFKVDFTPEGGEEEIGKKFSSRKEFYEWYNGDKDYESA